MTESGKTGQKSTDRVEDERKAAREAVMKHIQSLDQFDEVECSMNSRKRGRVNRVFHHYRYFVVMLSGLACGCMMLQRYCISVAILNMVNQTDLYLKSNPDKDYDDFLAEGYTEGGDFNWDNEIQNIIMSWYMIAYTLPQVGTTKLALMAGPRIAIPVAMFVCAGANLMIPVAAYWSWHWVVGLRLINGIGASFVIPIGLKSIENWMTYDEISLGLTISQILQVSLSSCSYLISGYLSAINWTLAFYVPGLAGILFGMVYFMLATDKPEDSWLVSDQELELIREAKSELAKKTAYSTGGIEEQSSSSMVGVLRVPSFYAYLFLWVIHCSSTTSTMFLQPVYLRQFLKVEISQTGLLNSMIETGTIVATLWPHPILHLLQSKGHLSLTAARRLAYGLVCLISALTWTAIGSFHRFQLILLFLNRCSDGSTGVLVMGSLMSNFSALGLSSLSFSMMNTVGCLSIPFLSTFFGWFLDIMGQSEAAWFWIYFMISVGQVFIALTFSTLIRSEPIQLNQRVKRNALNAVGGGSPEVRVDVGCDPETNQ